MRDYGNTKAAWIGATPPTSTPEPGQLWWRSDPDGNLFISYNDGTSIQWVPAVPFPKNTPPSGAAGGSLTGTYPNPTIAASAVTKPMMALGASYQNYNSAGLAATNGYWGPNVWNNVGSAILTTRGGLVLAFLTLNMAALSASSVESIHCMVTRDGLTGVGTQISGGYKMDTAGAGIRMPMPGMIGYDVPTAATHTYYANVYITGAGQMRSSDWTGMLMLIELS